jgi:hypothetical protein
MISKNKVVETGQEIEKLLGMGDLAELPKSPPGDNVVRLPTTSQDSSEPIINQARE